MINPHVDYDYIFNRVLDVTACIHIPLKLFAMHVVVKYTPNKLRHHSYFILDVMFWNFLANLALTFMHINPQFPADCFRGDGLTNLLVDSEGFGHALFMAVYVCLCNCTWSMVTAFAYRYISFAHPHFRARIRTSWVILFWCGAHASTTLMIPIYIQWMVAYDDYPNKAELPERAFVFCFRPDGYQKIFAITCFLMSSLAFLIIISFFSILFILKVRNEENASHPATIALQKKLFISLVITTAVTLLLGGFPMVVIILTTWLPHIPYSRYMTMVCVVIASNHGSIYAIAYLVLFKAYRDVVKQMLVKLTVKMKMRSVKNTVASSTVFHL